MPSKVSEKVARYAIKFRSDLSRSRLLLGYIQRFTIIKHLRALVLSMPYIPAALMFLSLRSSIEYVYSKVLEDVQIINRRLK